MQQSPRPGRQLTRQVWQSRILAGKCRRRAQGVDYFKKSVNTLKGDESLSDKSNQTGKAPRVLCRLPWGLVSVLINSIAYFLVNSFIFLDLLVANLFLHPISNTWGLKNFLYFALCDLGNNFFIQSLHKAQGYQHWSLQVLSQKI